METNLQEKCEGSPSHIRKFYGVKTFDRMEKFIQKFGKNYLNLAHNINGKDFPAFETFLSKVEFIQFEGNPFYKLFHGDLQFDNIIYNDNLNKFVYIDWRESFGGYTEAGDVYYDLAKLYGGCLIPYDKMKNEDNIKFVEGSYSVNYSYEVSESLQKFKKEFETWVNIQGYDLEKIKLITSLIFLNMSPLHEEKFGKLLWFKSIEMLYELTNK